MLRDGCVHSARLRRRIVAADASQERPGPLDDRRRGLSNATSISMLAACIAASSQLHRSLLKLCSSPHCARPLAAVFDMHACAFAARASHLHDRSHWKPSGMLRRAPLLPGGSTCSRVGANTTTPEHPPRVGSSAPGSGSSAPTREQIGSRPGSGGGSTVLPGGSTGSPGWEHDAPGTREHCSRPGRSG